MNKDTPIPQKLQFNLPKSRQNLLESTRLSRLPEQANRKKFELPKFDQPTKAANVCVSCAGRLDPDDAIQQSIKVCRKCLTQYAVVDAAIDAASKRKRQAMLEKFAPEVDDAY